MPALIFDAFWLVPLTQHERLCYLYLSSFCANRPWEISLTVVARVLRMDVKRVKRSIDALIARKMIHKTPRAGYAALYRITHMTAPGWGQTHLPLGANAPTPLGANAPTPPVQTHPLTTDLNTDAKASHRAQTGDEALLSMFRKHFTRWQFNRKPIGRHFVFTRPMVSKAIECMRHLNQTISTAERFDEFLSGVGEYLALPRDVLSTGRDQRALSPVAWLREWPEQIRLAGIYLDERERKVTRITSAAGE